MSKSSHLPPGKPPIRRQEHLKRNEPCPCNSARKFKKCCGETAMRWAICNDTGNSFFSDKDNRMLVFTSSAVAADIASLPVFFEQHIGEINVVGIGATRFNYLRKHTPYIEVADIDTAVTLVQARIDAKLADLETRELNDGKEEDRSQEDDSQDAPRSEQDSNA